MSETLIYMLALFGTSIIIFILFYFIITLSDLECDYLNVQECCDKLNYWLLPKYIAYCTILFVLLLNGYATTVVLNLPMFFYLTYELTAIPRGNIGVYDYIEINNRGQLKKHMRNVMYCLGFNFLFLFIYLYCLILAMLKSNPIPHGSDDEIITKM